jgi:hypothetical protein
LAEGNNTAATDAGCISQRMNTRPSRQQQQSDNASPTMPAATTAIASNAPPMTWSNVDGQQPLLQHSTSSLLPTTPPSPAASTASKPDDDCSNRFVDDLVSKLLEADDASLDLALMGAIGSKQTNKSRFGSLVVGRGTAAAAADNNQHVSFQHQAAVAAPRPIRSSQYRTRQAEPLPSVSDFGQPQTQPPPHYAYHHQQQRGHSWGQASPVDNPPPPPYVEHVSRETVAAFPIVSRVPHIHAYKPHVYKPLTLVIPKIWKLPLAVCSTLIIPLTHFFKD